MGRFDGDVRCGFVVYDGRGGVRYDKTMMICMSVNGGRTYSVISS